MISLEKEFIYVHIPKTGGMSIGEALKKYSLPLYLLEGNNFWTHVHSKYFHYIERFGQETWDEYYKFSFVRNPWDRLASAFFYLSKGAISIQDKQISDPFIKKYENNFTAFVKDFVANDQIKHIFHMHPQHEFIYDQKDRLVIDFVGRFENMQQGFDTICKYLGISPYQLPHVNKTPYRKAQHYTEYYNKETREIVARKYSKDIELFEYDFE